MDLYWRELDGILIKDN